MSLPQEQIDQYRDRGFTIAENVLDDSAFEPIEHAYDVLINHKAQELLEEGSISSVHADKSFSHRLAAIARELDDEGYDALRSFAGGFDIMPRV